MTGIRAAAALVLAGVFVAGCAARSRAPHRESGNEVAERLNRSVPWQQEESRPQAIRQRIEALSADTITADTAVELALLGNPRLYATLERIGVAQADLVDASLPSTIHLGGGLRFPLGGGSMGWEADAAISFIELLVLPLRRKVAKAQLNATILDVAQAVLQLDADVRSAFYRYVAAAQSYAVQEDIAETADLAADLADRQIEAATLSDLDAALHRAQAQEARAQLTRVQSEMLQEREHLTRLMGLWGAGAQWTGAESLPKLPRSEPELDRLETVAIAHRLDLAAARKEIQGLETAIRVARVNPFVGVEVGATGEREPGDGNTGLGPFIELEIPIFDWGQVDSARAEAQLRMAQYHLRAMAVDTRSVVREHRNRMVLQRRLVEFQRDVVLPQRQAIVRLAQERYDGMLLGVYELLAHKRDEFEARLELVAHIRDYWLARTDLELALGGRLEVLLARADPVTQD